MKNRVMNMNLIFKKLGRRFLSVEGLKKTNILSNGIKVYTSFNKNEKVQQLGLFFKAGSRTETEMSNGVASLSTNILAQNKIDGVYVNAMNTKDINGLIFHFESQELAKVLEHIKFLTTNYKEIFEKVDYSKAKTRLIKQSNLFELNYPSMVIEHLVASAFQGNSLSLPTLGTPESISNLEVEDSLRFLSSYFCTDNFAIAATGDIEENELINTLESIEPTKKNDEIMKPAVFLGSEVRIRDDTLPKVYVSIAVKGESFNSSDYMKAKVAAAVFGSYHHTDIFSRNSGTKLSSIVQKYEIVDKYNHFSKSFSDIGLWGFNSESSNIAQIDDFVHFALKEWNRLSISISDMEVHCAKEAVKVQILKEFYNPKWFIYDVAQSLLFNKSIKTIGESLKEINSITTKDIKNWALSSLWDKDIVVSSTGQTEAIYDYHRIRNEMSMLRW